MKKITFLLLSVACMALAANAEVNVHVRTLDGSVPYLYAWTGAGTLNGDWPGTQMDASQTSTTPDGLVWITQSFDQDAISLIFNDGGDPAIQTGDINGAVGDVYFIVDLEEGEFTNVTSTYVKQDEFDKSILPAGVTYKEGVLFAYFRVKSWTACKCWCWNSDENFTGGTWPGADCTLVGTDKDGYNYFLWEGPAIPEVLPTGIIFSNGSQTSDLNFINGGIYELSSTGDPIYVVEKEEDPGVLGDVNGDGQVTAADVSAVYNIILGASTEYQDKADVNGDGQVTAADVSVLYNIILGA